MKLLVDPTKKALSQVDQLRVSIPKPSPCNWKHKSLVPILFISLTIGSLIQIYGITREYLSAPTTESIDTTSGQNHVKIPALSFCTSIGDITHGMTSDLFFDLNNVQDVVEYIKVVPGYGGQPINYTHYLDYSEESISYKYYCFTVNSPCKSHKMEIEKGQNVLIKLNRFGNNKNWWIFMHNSYDVPSSYEWNAVEIKPGFYVEVSYTHESFERMDTNCVNYPKTTEYTSRKDCIRKCKLRESLHRCGAVYNGVDVKKGEESVKFALTKKEKECFTKMLESGDGCSQKCSQSDCEIDSYKPYLISKYQNNWDYTIVQLSPPHNPELIYKQGSGFKGRAHLYYMSANLIVWLGLALYLLYNKCSKISAQNKITDVFTIMTK